MTSTTTSDSAPLPAAAMTATEGGMPQEGT